jgi:PII-like signaling protein
MNELTGEQVLIRIFIGESDKREGIPLYQWIVELLRREKIRGATVLRGILGFGAASHVHTSHILRLSQDLPMVVEFVDTQENIDRVLPQIEPFVVDGLITSERVKVIKYGTVRKK